MANVQQKKEEAKKKKVTHQCTSMRQTSRDICSVCYRNKDVTAVKIKIYKSCTCTHGQKKVTIGSLMFKAKCYTINALYKAFNLNALKDFVLVVEVISANQFSPKVDNRPKSRRSIRWFKSHK